MHVTRRLCASLLPLLLGGCALGYGLQAARGQWELSRKAQPIETVIDAPASSERLRNQLQAVRAVREFATQELGLPDNGSYRRYAALGRPYVLWNVVVTPELSLAPRRWCFPVAGCVSYRGYFREASAQRFAAAQRRRGHDATVGGVPAYSTLGYFQDPVPDSLLRHGELAAAETIIHELAHQRLYVPGDSDFNEAFATVVATEGLRRWLAVVGRSQDLERLAAREAAAAQFDRELRAARDDLERTYAAQLSVEEKRRFKQQRLAQLASGLQALQQRLGARAAIGEWLREGLNNAQLAALATYDRCVPGLRGLLQSLGNDLARFYAEAERLAVRPLRERTAAVCAPPLLP